MSVTAAKGFVAGAVHSGLRRSGPDLALVRSLIPATGAAMFTVNRVKAATGVRGELDARATAAETARLLGLDAEQVLVLSTGVIGKRLALDKILPALRHAASSLSDEGGPTAAEAILTTDTHAKQAVAQGPGFTVGGMAKGSGMIHPNLATMLAVVTTDFPLEPGEAAHFLRPAVDESFNAISVDGECSMNDTVVLLANGAGDNDRSAAD